MVCLYDDIMNQQIINHILKNEPAFRLKQINKLIYQDLIDDWNKATVLPASLRDKLKVAVDLNIPAEFFNSQNSKTTKALITLEDGLEIEAVLMRYEGRNTVCVSSQVGCPLNCAFCSTGKMGFKRNLTSGEIISQILLFARQLKKESQKINNIVFMGMGEPFLNYKNVMDAIKILNDPACFNIGARHLSVSTSGIIEGINKLADSSLQLNLALSLHAPNDSLRSRLMPVNKKYPLNEVITAVKNYLLKTNRKVMFEYLMIDGINDSLQNAGELSALLKNLLCVINLIPYNPTGGFKPSKVENIAKFRQYLVSQGFEVTQRAGFGSDVKGACGQLAVDNKNQKVV